MSAGEPSEMLSSDDEDSKDNIGRSITAFKNLGAVRRPSAPSVDLR